MTRLAGGAAAEFIRRETRLSAPPLVPEIRLWLATEMVGLWQATEETLIQADIEPPFWAIAWPGGQAMARHILDHPDLVRGRQVLVVGAGSGLEALAAVQAGASRVTAADIDPLALEAIRLNAQANGIASSTLELTPENLLGGPIDADVVLSGDLCYERKLAERLMPWLRQAAATDKTVLLADPGRNYRPTDGLRFIARYPVPTSLDVEDSTLRETDLWQVLP